MVAWLRSCFCAVLVVFAVAKPPNFVFYFPDETRAESLGTYGHPITKTPNYDRLAAKGTTFKQAHVLHTQCSPSRCALLTGRYLHTTGHRTQQHLVQSWEPNMFRYLKEAGYHVAWFGKNDALAADAFPSSVDTWQGYDLEAVLEFIKNPPAEPFMLWIPTKGSHPPYVGEHGSGFPFGTAGYYSFYNNGTSQYNPDDIKRKAPLRAAGLPNKPKYHYEIPQYRNLTTLDEDFFYRLNAVYLGMVSATDADFGKIMDAVEENKALADSTAFIVSSDHGDFAGDSHLVEKWPGGMDDMLTHVPLIISAPGGAAGHVVESPVQLFDVFPTIADLAGIALNHTHFAKSLKNEVFGGEGVEGRMVYSEGGYLYPTEIEPLHSGGGTPGPWGDKTSAYFPRGSEEMEGCRLTPGDWTKHDSEADCHGSPRAVMIRNTTHKLVYRPNGESELYDLSHDPRELNNRWDEAEMKDVQSWFLGQLLSWMVTTSDVTPMAVDERGLPKKE